jgi:hypothetical protein
MWRCLSSALYAPTPPYTSARFADIRCHIASAHPTIRFWMCPHPGCGFGCKTDKAFFAHCMAAQGRLRRLVQGHEISRPAHRLHRQAFRLIETLRVPRAGVRCCVQLSTEPRPSPLPVSAGPYHMRRLWNQHQGRVRDEGRPQVREMQGD